MQTEQFLTRQEVADQWRVSKATIMRLIARGDLREVRIGNVSRLRAADVEAFVERLPEAS